MAEAAWHAGFLIGLNLGIAFARHFFPLSGGLLDLETGNNGFYYASHNGKSQSGHGLPRNFLRRFCRLSCKVPNPRPRTYLGFGTKPMCLLETDRPPLAFPNFISTPTDACGSITFRHHRTPI